VYPPFPFFPFQRALNLSSFPSSTSEEHDDRFEEDDDEFEEDDKSLSTDEDSVIEAVKESVLEEDNATVRDAPHPPQYFEGDGCL
jgi:hypothetical protein